MNYRKQYDSLIERGKNRTLKGYSEKHHIIPKCMGGSNDKENIVRLTGEEHFKAHFLLTEVYPENEGLVFAANIMANRFGGKEIDAKKYEKLKKRHAKAMSEIHKGIPKGPFAEEHKEKLRGPRSPMSEEQKVKRRGPQSEETVKKKSKPILCTTNGIIYPSTKEAAKQLGLNAGNITSVLRGRYKHTCGYHFEYVNKK